MSAARPWLLRHKPIPSWSGLVALVVNRILILAQMAVTRRLPLGRHHQYWPWVAVLVELIQPLAKVRGAQVAQAAAVLASAAMVAHQRQGKATMAERVLQPPLAIAVVVAAVGLP